MSDPLKKCEGVSRPATLQFAKTMKCQNCGFVFVEESDTRKAAAMNCPKCKTSMIEV